MEKAKPKEKSFEKNSESSQIIPDIMKDLKTLKEK
jgi:hypothetical protein